MPFIVSLLIIFPSAPQKLIARWSMSCQITWAVHSVLLSITLEASPTSGLDQKVLAREMSMPYQLLVPGCTITELALNTPSKRACSLSTLSSITVSVEDEQEQNTWQITIATNKNLRNFIMY